MHCVSVIVKWKAFLCSPSDGDIINQCHLESEQMKIVCMPLLISEARLCLMFLKVKYNSLKMLIRI